MQAPVLSSTALLTVLLAVGLMFFIRASTKDRIEVAKWVSEQPEEALLEKLQQYFSQRAYRVAGVDADQNQIKFEGFVRPSWFMAIFLTLLAATGLLCLSLILAISFPAGKTFFPALALISPLAGWFYWQKSARPEQVLLRVDKVAPSEQPDQRLLTVTGHRDELAELQRSLNLKPLES